MRPEAVLAASTEHEAGASADWVRAPMIWDGEDPEFEDQAEADLILGTMFARFNEISDRLDNDGPGTTRSSGGTPPGAPSSRTGAPASCAPSRCCGKSGK